jgi:hypothetical protein
MALDARELLARIGSYIPGYTGYAERESRRATDRALREGIAKRLGEVRAAVDRKLSDAATAMRFDLLEPLERSKRRIETLADRIRLAPAGYSALFDAATLGTAELDRLHALDLELREHVETLATSVAAGVEAGTSFDRVEETLRRRDAALKGAA